MDPGRRPDWVSPHVPLVSSRLKGIVGADTMSFAARRRKLRLREVRQLAHDHTASEWQSEDFSPRPVLFGSVLVTWSPEAPRL